jgi:hypothetical protein
MSAPGQTFSATTSACLLWFDRRSDFLRLDPISGRIILFSPIHGVLIGLSPVKMNASYKKPPNVHPRNGAIMGIWGSQHSISAADGIIPRSNNFQQTTLHGRIQQNR